MNRFRLSITRRATGSRGRNLLAVVVKRRVIHPGPAIVMGHKRVGALLGVALANALEACAAGHLGHVYDLSDFIVGRGRFRLVGNPRNERHAIVNECGFNRRRRGLGRPALLNFV